MAGPSRNPTTDEKVTFTLSGIRPDGGLGAFIQAVVVVSSDPTIATATLNADGVTGVCTSTGTPGSMSVKVAAQNAAGVPISGSGDLTWEAVALPLAVAVSVTFDEPTPK